MGFLPAGRWPQLRYLTLIKLINHQVTRSIIIEMTFPMLLLRGQEGQGEGAALRAPEHRAVHTSTCSCPISTGSSKTVQTTTSLQSGVVREPW